MTEVQQDRKLYLLFTHSDWDHIIASAAFPDAVRIGSLALVERPDWQEALDTISEFDAKHYLRRSYPIEYPKLDVVIDHDGQRLALGDPDGGAAITFHLAPGHTPCGLLSFVEPHGVLLVGDYLSDVEMPFIYFGSQPYEATLCKAADMLSELAVRVLVPGHGQYTTDVAEMRRRVAAAYEYIAAARAYVREDEGAAAALAGILRRYPFAAGMKDEHEQNLELFRRELKG